MGVIQKKGVKTNFYQKLTNEAKSKKSKKLTLGAFTKDVLSKRGGGGLKKRTALHFPILFVKDFCNLKDERGRGVKIIF